MASDSIWAQPEPGRRKARFTREQIGAAALALADREGLQAVTMRRLAEELDTAPMTLYHYVRTKDDVLALMDDAFMGELHVPEGGLPEDDWRAALTAIARHTRDAMARHPWVIHGLRGAQFSPNAMRHVEQSLQAAASTGLGPARQFEVIAVVDDFVFGSMMREAVMPQDDDWFESSLPVMRAYLATGDYPYLQQMLGDDDPVAVRRRYIQEGFGEDRFEHGLALLLDGIEKMIKER